MGKQNLSKPIVLIVKHVFFLFLSNYCTVAMAQSQSSLITLYELHKTNYTATYQECVDWYAKADSAFETVKVLDYGPSDAGHPMQLAVLSADKDFDHASLHAKNKRIILIMNAIHPGEPEGVDASMLLLKDLATNPSWATVLKDVVICIIPQYNIEGVLNRGSYSRANQDGPESYGFRGNGQNLDLNRDFMKCDSRNTLAFQRLFHDWNPDVFIDNHTSDGADYQHTLTYIAPIPGSLAPELESFVNQELTPEIGKYCSGKNYRMAPYVESYGETPDSGLTGFYAMPRYSMGFVALWGTIGYTVETHMLKPFDKRLEANLVFMEACILTVHKNKDQIGRLRPPQQIPNRCVLNNILDTSKYETIPFEGYEAGHKNSLVSGAPRLFYDRTKPWKKRHQILQPF